MKLVHSLGLELRTTAVCKQVRRIRFGHFTLSHALLQKQWDVKSVIDNIRLCRPFVREGMLLLDLFDGNIQDVGGFSGEGQRLLPAGRDNTQIEPYDRKAKREEGDKIVEDYYKQLKAFEESLVLESYNSLNQGQAEKESAVFEDYNSLNQSQVKNVRGRNRSDNT